MIEKFQQVAREIYERAQREGRLFYNLPVYDLKKIVLEEPEVKETIHGNIMANSEPTSRAAMFTENSVDSNFGPEEEELLKQAREALSKEKIISIDVLVGDGSEGITARLIVPKRFAHLALGGVKLFGPAITKTPTHQVIMFSDREFEKNKLRLLPEKDITIRNAYSLRGGLIKIVRNSNYLGEWKKGVFAGEDYRAKLRGDAIFLHAGCRKDYLEMAHGGYQTKYSLFVALSANGKTSLACKVLAKKGKEKSWLIQDDGGTLTREGAFKGFELGGLFVKTNQLNPRDQMETYYGVLKPNTYLENVYVDEAGEIDFYNVERTSNGRAVIERRDFIHTAGEINVESINNLFIITRGNAIPAIAKLTPEQATAFMVLGQSMESSAGNPTETGKIKNVFFYDPFVAGDRIYHANLFYDILKSNPGINCYLLNTGGVGEGERYRDIALQDTMGILDSLLRGGLEDWVEAGGTGLMVPRAVRTVDSILMNPQKLYSASEFEEKQKKLNKQRREVLERYPGLNKKIYATFE